VVAAVERAIREVIPPRELRTILDNVGISPSGGSSLAFSDNPTIGVADANILISLTDGPRRSVDHYRRELRRRLRAEFPQVTFFFQAADIVGQILNFGLPAPIDVQVAGSNKKANYEIAKRLEGRIRRIPGAVDVHVHQVVDAPELFFAVDRDRATSLALSERDVASNVLVSLASSGQTAPNFWLDPRNGVQYQVSVRTPQHLLNSVEAIASTPILPGDGGGAGGAGAAPQMLDNVARMTRRVGYGVINHYNVQPVFDVYANVQDRDLGAVARDIDRVLDEVRATLPRGSTIVMRGQVQSMRSSFLGLGLGLAFAVVLVYLLMVVNFQSWVDPLVIITALPGALAGIVWTLYVTQTTLSVPSLMGAIMCVGVATANSILIVSFANERRRAGLSALDAALDAGHTRLRPVLMTAAAMVVGMLPMALGMGEGGEQNAPLGRAVVGGLAVATVATLFIVPIAYAVLRGRSDAAPQGADAAGAGPRELAA
jgi:multidrug efflux pump subunit AcrB